MTGIAGNFVASIRSRVSKAAWIESPGFDVFLLIFAPLVTLPIIAGIYWRIPILAIGGAITLAFAHYLSTLAFFFWDENREYHRARWAAFVGGPVILATVYILLLGLEVPYVIQVILFFWNTFHVARQNCGILAIYRQRAGVNDPVQKEAANHAILASSVFLALWNIETHPEVAALFGLVSGELIRIARLWAGVAAAVFVGHLAYSLFRRKDPIGLPEGLFLASSVAFFYPYLFIRNSEIATFAMLLPHYVQYMALVWLLHRRKFGAAKTGAPVALLRVSGSLLFLVPLLCAVGFSFYLMKEFFESRGLRHWFEALYLIIALEHFYLDGLIWSFRRAHVRQTMAPFLVRGRIQTTT